MGIGRATALALAGLGAEVTALALEFRLMSAFTSFVAVDAAEVVNPGGEGSTVHQALPIPEGVSFHGVFGPEGPHALRVEASAPQFDYTLPADTSAGDVLIESVNPGGSAGTRPAT